MEKKPVIRIKGYEGEWEVHSVGDFYDFKNGLNKGKDFFGVGTPIVNYVDVYKNRSVWSADIKGKVTLTPEEIRNYQVRKGDLFFTRTSETVEEIGFSAVMMDEPTDTVFSGFVLRGRATGDDPMEDIFKQYAFFADSFRAEMMKKSTISTRALTSGTAIKKMDVSFPKSKNEQIKVGTTIGTIDDLITLHQRKFAILLSVRKSMLQKMFPRNGSSVPEIRFKGFEGEWEEKRFDEIVSRYLDPVETPCEGYYRLGIRSHAKGTFHSYVEKGQELETAQMSRVAADNFIVNITFGWEHAVAITSKNDEGKLVSHRFPQFSFNEGMLPAYFKYLIIDEKFKHHLWLSSPGGAGRNRVLKIDEMLQYKFWTPEEDEQKKISEFFERLDVRIDLQQKKLTALKNTKKALLSKMFV